MARPSDNLPRAGPLREALREKGQFWTPDWVADAMVRYALADGSDHLFDPAVGAGAFFLAAKRFESSAEGAIGLLGTEIDPAALQKAKACGLSSQDLRGVEVRDFLLDPPTEGYRAIVANPPYIRHHRIPADVKVRLGAFARSLLGVRLDARAGTHVYFFLRALQLLKPGGRLAFIVPADTCEGVFASPMWRWILSHYALDAVITFEPGASPFPGVDTNPVILLLRNRQATGRFVWARCLRPETDDLSELVGSTFQAHTETIQVVERDVSEALVTGLTRPAAAHPQQSPTLGEFASVLRGIATGANDFFFLTRSRASELGIPPELLLPAVGRTRDIPGSQVTRETLHELDARGRPTVLFSPDGRPRSRFPDSVQRYLRKGEREGLSRRPLISSRRPWYRMERRQVPPILFAYLGRRNARFIRNLAGAVPLTGFLCVYPRRRDPRSTDRLWHVLSDTRTLANLPLVGKSYGGGAIKVEPRALEALPVPPSVLSESGLEWTSRDQQLSLAYRE